VEVSREDRSSLISIGHRTCLGELLQVFVVKCEFAIWGGREESRAVTFGAVCARQRYSALPLNLGGVWWTIDVAGGGGEGRCVAFCVLLSLVSGKP